MLMSRVYIPSLKLMQFIALKVYVLAKAAQKWPQLVVVHVAILQAGTTVQETH